MIFYQPSVDGDGLEKVLFANPNELGTLSSQGCAPAGKELQMLHRYRITLSPKLPKPSGFGAGRTTTARGPSTIVIPPAVVSTAIATVLFSCYCM